MTCGTPERSSANSPAKYREDEGTERGLPPPPESEQGASRRRPPMRSRRTNHLRGSPKKFLPSLWGDLRWTGARMQGLGAEEKGRGQEENEDAPQERQASAAVAHREWPGSGRHGLCGEVSFHGLDFLGGIGPIQRKKRIGFPPVLKPSSGSPVHPGFIFPLISTLVEIPIHPPIHLPDGGMQPTKPMWPGFSTRLSGCFGTGSS